MNSKRKTAFFVAGVFIALGATLMIISFVALGSDISQVSFSIGVERLPFEVPSVPTAPDAPSVF